jgi:hypothetical protein
LSDLNDLQSPNCNLLSSPSDCFPYSGLEEFNREAATLAAETNEFEYLRYDQSNVRSINSFTVSDDQIMDEIYHNRQHANMIYELDCLEKSISRPLSLLLLESEDVWEEKAERISIISFMLHQSGNLDGCGALRNYLCEIDTF